MMFVYLFNCLFVYLLNRLEAFSQQFNASQPLNNLSTSQPLNTSTLSQLPKMSAENK